MDLRRELALLKDEKKSRRTDKLLLSALGTNCRVHTKAFGRLIIGRWTKIQREYLALEYLEYGSKNVINFLNIFFNN